MTQPARAFSFSSLLAYGGFGLPLAMLALPVYVYAPQFYARQGGARLTLAAIGAALLATRLLAAFSDPVLGWLVQRGQAARPGYRRYVAWALAPLLGGFFALFHPPALGAAATLCWFVAALLLVYGGFGLAGIAYQSWGAALSSAPQQRSRITAVREGCGLLGVIVVAGALGSLSQDGLSLLFAGCLLAGAAPLLLWAPRPAGSRLPAPGLHPLRAMLAPLHVKTFRALFAVLLVNGVATAVPATLFLFFADDRLRLGPDAGYFLVLYFVAAAASMPLWVALARRFGEARAWCGAMLLAALVFVWAGALGAGALLAFGLICLLSGLALGADLALPPALLAGVIDRAGHGGRGEAAYFGLWNWGTQLTLALAAGIALPLLQWLGYVPGQGGMAGAGGTTALALAYAVLPCILKLAAAALLWRAPLADI